MSHCVSHSHRGLAEDQPTPAEPRQDSGYVVGFSAAGQSQRLASGVDTYQHFRDGTWPLCPHRQSAVAVCTGGCHVSQWLLPDTAAPTTCQIYVSRGRKDAGPGVHFMSHGLLQLTFTASPMVWWARCSLSRMWLHVWCWALDVMTTSRLCYRSCTGFQFDIGWISRWPPWSACHCPAWLQLIWPLTASWSLAKVVVSCVLPYQERALWGEPTATMETGVL